MANKTSFWNFIKNNRIEIPIIQRDYAQGRVGKEYLRKSFLGDLKKALDNEPPFRDTEMKLDFVYGSIESGNLNPLDGQQRLTTLWLLHWYIALRAGLLYRACPILSKFSYETRISSREFCEKLCEPENFDSYSVDKSIVDYITNQTWFYSSWKQDPTIQAMLRMLSGTSISDKNGDDIIDGIEEIFHCTRQPEFNKYWWNLCSEKSPIKFYQLALNDFGLSDDLYIKMNARGKQLTAFENFKANLIGYLRMQDEDEQINNNSHNRWKVLLNPTDGIPILMDTLWTDVFWKNKSVGILYENGNIKNANKIDEIYFAFINRFFWNELFISKDVNGKYILNVGDGKLKDGTETRTIEIYNPSYRHLNEDRYELFSDFSPYLYYKDNKDHEDELKKIPFSFFKDLMTVLGNLATYKDQMPICKWNKTFQFIPVYEKDEKQLNNIENKDKDYVLKVSSLNQIQRIVFFAVCKYFKEGPADRVSLNRWMRVIWNLVSGEDEVGRPQIRNTEGMRKVIEFIDSINNSHKVYECLKKITINDDSEFGSRCLEEVIKARQILTDKNQIRKYYGRCFDKRGQILVTWEDIIKEAEEHAFFNGSIRFLYLNDKGDVDWNSFDTKWENAKKYFDDDGVTNEFRKNSLLLRRFLSSVDKINKEMWFGNGDHFWHHVLLNQDYCMQIHDLLIGSSKISSKKDWIAEENLLGNVINNNDKWHILDNWRGYNVLTRYSNRQSGSVSAPNQIIVLDHRRNSILLEVESPNRIANTSFFHGWDVIFKYRGFTFKWYGVPDDIYKDICLMKNENDYWKRNVDGTHEKEFYSFNVADNETIESFRQRLVFLINDAVCK